MQLIEKTVVIWYFVYLIYIGYWAITKVHFNLFSLCENAELKFQSSCPSRKVNMWIFLALWSLNAINYRKEDWVEKNWRVGGGSQTGPKANAISLYRIKKKLIESWLIFNLCMGKIVHFLFRCQREKLLRLLVGKETIIVQMKKNSLYFFQCLIRLKHNLIGIFHPTLLILIKNHLAKNSCTDTQKSNLFVGCNYTFLCF